MPWRERSPMELRDAFIADYVRGVFTVTALASEYDISRKTAYKWIDRYEAGGRAALADRSRRPHTLGRQTDPAVWSAVLAMRRRYPRFGAKKLLKRLRDRDPTVAWPSRSAVCDRLHQAGLIVPRRRRRRDPHPLGPRVIAAAPNDTWTTDFKGEFRTGDGRYCYPLTLRDACSRYVLRCDGLEARRGALTRVCFQRAFAEFGLPRRIRSDNGTPFAGVGLARLSRLNVWWLRLGIVPERICPGRPEQNGSHERYHADLAAATTRPPAATRRAQQQRFNRYRRLYNEERPHEALGDDYPGARYAPSPRPLPETLPPVEYPGHFEVRRVGNSGSVSWRGQFLFTTEVLAGEPVGFEAVDEGLWTVYYATVAIARFDERDGRLRELPT